MRTLTSGGLRRLRHLRPELSWILVWAGALAGIEILGRRASSDVGDGVGVGVLASLLLLTGLRHASRPLRFVERLLELGQRALAHLAPLRIRLGLDLRRRPPLPERIPALLALPLVAVCAALFFLWLARGALPGGARALLVRTSCAIYIGLLTLLWGLLTASSLLLFSFPLAYLDEKLRHSAPWSSARERSLLWTGTAYALLLVVLATLLPPWAPLAAILAALAAFAGLSLVPNGPPLLMVWKQADGSSPPAVFRWGTLTMAIQLGGIGIVFCLVLLSRGDALFEERTTDTPITAFLGLALSWTFLGGYLVELGLLSSVLAGGWFRNPGRPQTPRVHVAGALSRAERRSARQALACAGLAPIFASDRRRTTDVPVEVRAGTEARSDAPSWPRALSLDALADPVQHAALRRRSELLCRRALRKGLQRILKAAAARSFEKGSGFWIAPHQWFVTHLTRDVDEDVLGHVGPSYAAAIPLSARRHAHAVFEALEIDLLFLEDGVGFAGLRRVLSMLFEYYDLFGGKRLADERHFSGLPGIRVLIHDYVLDEPLRSARYPEPEYEDLGRARILHVFRDRGGDEEDAPVPWDADWLPAPFAPELILA